MASTHCSSFLREILHGTHLVSPPAWVQSTAYVIGDRVNNDTGKIYECITAGTSAGSGGPTGTNADITDNTAHWKYVAAAADVFKIALFTTSWTGGLTTTAYSATNEASGTGYSAGGATLTGDATALTSNVASIDWGNATWTNGGSNNCSFSFQYALIYNSSKGNKACCVIDCGSQTVTSTLTINIPSSGTGLLRIG